MRRGMLVEVDHGLHGDDQSHSSLQNHPSRQSHPFHFVSCLARIHDHDRPPIVLAAILESAVRTADYHLPLEEDCGSETVSELVTCTFPILQMTIASCFQMVVLPCSWAIPLAFVSSCNRLPQQTTCGPKMRVPSQGAVAETSLLLGAREVTPLVRPSHPRDSHCDCSSLVESAGIAWHP
jgi:hypothetical protein